MAAVSAPRLLYIVSPSYSGSTLLTYLLARHPRIATIGELKATNLGDVSEYRCSCGEVITACPFWQAVTERCRERGIAFSVDDFGTALRSQNRLVDRLLRARVRSRPFETIRRIALSLPPARRELSALLERNFEVAHAVCRVQQRDIFLDGSKDAPRLLLFAKSGLWDVRTIFLKRDGRGVVNSFMTRRGFDTATAVLRWQRAVNEMLHVRRHLDPASVIDVSYEELCRKPADVLTSIWRWLGVDEVPPAANFRVGEYHILGNDMRLSNVTEIRIDERWRQKLGPDALQYFNSHAGALNRALGYS